MIYEKINAGMNYPDGVGFFSDLYRKYQICFNALLDPEINNYEYIEECYVENTSEIDLKSSINDYLDGIYYLVGYTGIGKSTMLCHLIKTEPNCTVPKIINNNLILPIFFDSYLYDENEEIRDSTTRRIASYVNYLIDFFNPNIFKSYKYKEELYNLIKKTKPDLLQYGISNNIDSLSFNLNDKLEQLHKNNLFAYYTCKLKLLLVQPEIAKKINKVTLLIDDIETLPETYVFELIQLYHKFFECLKNNKERNYKVKLLISARPHTLRYMNTQNNLHRKLESYGVTKIIEIKNPPPISEIFKKRFEYFKKENVYLGQLQISNPTSWNEGFDILISICKQLDVDVGKLLYNLHHNNIRETLRSFTILLSNRYWLQRRQQVEGSFSISMNDYCLTKSVVLKAIIIGNGPTYVNNGVVPNILCSSKYKNLSYYSLLVIQHFLLNNSVYNYGITNVNISEFINNCAELWGSEIKKDFVTCINHHINNKILLYSIREEEYENKEITEADSRKLYLSAKGKAIWDLLSNDSVLIECYREDTYRKVKHKNSRLTNENLSQEEILVDCLLFIEDIVSEEMKTIRGFINSKQIDEYHKLFGESMISKHLLQGIENTVKYYFVAHSRILSDEYVSVYNKIKKQIDDCYKHIG